ncbi:TetR/AcrR family transcriptional regulator [Streptosporangium sp. NPDC023615]|uniref:TetR/AcrR family transcriptional regulator n=1 Tax=Streptosporangium sp. NPDC023615 TaxID=3154794 RepID=UPI0034353AA3
MTDENQVSAEVTLLWGLRETVRRGRKPSLTVAEITRAAVEVADAEGLAAVSMARIAAHLGNATMTLYRYVKSKDELLLLMADAALDGPPDLPDDVDWRTGLTLWVKGVLTVLRRHPWAAQIPVSGPPMGPNNLWWFDRALRALAGTGLEEEDKVGVVMGLVTFVHGELRLSIDLSASYAENPEAFGRQYGMALARVVDARRFPALSRVIATGIFEGDVPYDEEVEGAFALNLYLDGVGAFIERRTAGREGRTPDGGPEREGRSSGTGPEEDRSSGTGPEEDRSSGAEPEREDRSSGAGGRAGAAPKPPGPVGGPGGSDA